MATHVWSQKAACHTCGATGLYIGCAERDGAAVVCNACKGSGEITIRVQWDDFAGRALRNEVRRVFELNPGLLIGAGRHGSDEYCLADFGGIPYEDWVAGEPFPPGSENRRFTCPSWWYQSANYQKEPNWPECRVRAAFRDCPQFRNKSACWARWDKEFGSELASESGATHE